MSTSFSSMNSLRPGWVYIALAVADDGFGNLMRVTDYILDLDLIAHAWVEAEG